MIETRDRELLEDILRREEVWAGYMLGDLDDAQFARTRWFLSNPEGTSLALVYQLGDHATLLTCGSPAPELVATVPLPESFDVHYPATHAAALNPLFDGELKPHVRLALRRHELAGVVVPAEATLVTLTAADVPAALELYAHYPENWFNPTRIEEGIYVGLEQDGALVAVGGTHVRSTQTRVAALGDIVTAPDRRGRGLGAFLTHALCERLFADVDLIVLNVLASNAAAKRAYAKVGFEHGVDHIEGNGVRRIRSGSSH